MTNSFPEPTGFSEQKFPLEPTQDKYHAPEYIQPPQYTQGNTTNFELQKESSYELFAILAVISIVLLNTFGVMPLVLGYIALHRLKTNGKRGKFLAITALIAGYISAFLMLTVVAVTIVLSQQ